MDNREEAVEIVLSFCGDTCAGSGSRQSPLIHQTWQMDRVAELVKPSPDTAVGAIDEAAFDKSVSLLLDVGLLSSDVSFEEVVDTTIYNNAVQ